MMFSKIRIGVYVALLAAGFVGLACSSDGTSVPAAVPIATTEAVVRAPASIPEAPTAGYDSNQAMHAVFPGFSLTSQEMIIALDEIAIRRDRSLVPVLVEIIRYMPSALAHDRVGDALRAVTGQDFESDNWDAWMEWLGRNRADYPPPSDYVRWKIGLMSDLDPRFATFLRPALEFSRIDLTEVVWGGVLPDEIPDLRNPPTIAASEADYLNVNDRVFGVTINGDSRAYPLSIVNAHEMVNDVVGEEPISLMW